MRPQLADCVCKNIPSDLQDCRCVSTLEWVAWLQGGWREAIGKVITLEQPVVESGDWRNLTTSGVDSVLVPSSSTFTADHWHQACSPAVYTSAFSAFSFHRLACSLPYYTCSIKCPTLCARGVVRGSSSTFVVFGRVGCSSLSEGGDFILR
ncbi:hypothetical protein RRG08_039073 [Elysia crispata]|uniref:Uncharacterized protein n=1 Tax=Elysia crispata TaxID=231223 RepID=A0AAE0YIY9_9GAST|nr:hypothetical protein RRG08_039073 [Elysia crispata]